MKITLYIRRDAKRGDRVNLFCRAEDEPCYDTPRILNLGAEIKQAVDNIIADCERTGVIAAKQNAKMARVNEIEKGSTKCESISAGQ